MKDIYESMIELLESKEDFVLATILEKHGSAPREEGAKMIIKRDFSIVGTIGGGIFEAMAIKLSSKVFQDGFSIVKSFSLTNEGAAALGAACGGNVKLLLEYVDYNDSKMVDIYKSAFQIKVKGDNFAVITKIPKEDISVRKIDKWICGESSFYGEEDNTVQLICRRIREDFKNIAMKNVNLEGEQYLIEPILNNEIVYIIGAGHVSQKIAQITNMLDFKTVVIDDRDEFANRERFKTVEEVKVISSFENILQYIKVNNNSYIIIVTRGHAYDKDVLSQVLRTDAKYIGMIGSRKKREFVYNSLLNEGYTSEDLKKVYSPIGVSIFAQTPEEIAVSIVAELIKVKREPLNERR